MSSQVELCILQAQEFLSTHRGRDKILRSIQFLARFCGGCLQISGLSPGEGVLNVASSISSTRVVLRLLDDVAMVGFVMKGLRQFKVRPDLYSLLDLLDAAVGMVFLPVEHLAFFGDQRLTSYGTDRLHTSATVLWLASLLINLSQLMMKIAISREDKLSLSIPLIQCVSDLILAVHYLPQGFLWSGQLPLTMMGLLGLISSVLGLYRLIQSSKKN